MLHLKRSNRFFSSFRTYSFINVTNYAFLHYAPQSKQSLKRSTPTRKEKHSIYCALYSTHCYSFSEEKPTASPIQRSKVEVLYEEAHALYLSKRHDAAIQATSNCIKLCEQEKAHQSKIAPCHFLLGIIYTEMNQFLKAEDEYKQAIELYKTQGTNAALSIAHCLSNMGLLAFYQQKFDEAVKNTLESIETLKKMPNADKYIISNFYNQLAMIYAKQNDYTNALPAYLESYNYLKSASAEETDDLAESLFNVTYASLKAKKYDEFEKYLTEYQTMKLKTATKGSRTGLSESLNQIGVQLLDDQRLEAAIKVFEDALKNLGVPDAESPDLKPRILVNSAIAHLKMNNDDAGLSALKQGIETHRERFGLETPEHAEFYFQMGRSFLMKGLRKHAWGMFLESEKLFSKGLPDDHPKRVLLSQIIEQLRP